MLPSYEVLKSLLHQEFLMTDEAGAGPRQRCQLVAISDRRLAAAFETFSLSFQGLDFAALTQGLYTFEHSTIGACQLFVTPRELGRDKKVVFDAVFNRHVVP